MDATKKKGVHVETEVVRPLPVLDTSMRPKRKYTVHGIWGINQ